MKGRRKEKDENGEERRDDRISEGLEERRGEGAMREGR